jgi:hypothetical protein
VTTCYSNTTVDIISEVIVLENMLKYSLSVTFYVVSSNPEHGEVHSMQHYVIKFVSDLRQLSGFLEMTIIKKLSIKT